MSIKRWKLTIEYNGTPFAGWQRQDGIISVQEAIEVAIEKFCQQRLSLYAAGRTDSGVHARGQVAHFDFDYGEREINEYELCKAINAHLLPQPVSVLAAEIVDENFHARFDAKNKRYTYRILCRSAPPVLERNRVWHFHKNLNVLAMQKAGQHLLGHHDFSSFRGAHCQAKTAFRTLDRMDIEEKTYDFIGSREVVVSIEAQSFLHHQVRNIVGTLALVGQGKWEPEDVRTALEARDRTKAGPTAPACGLYLDQIQY